ncbi:hypothetical protein EDB86DRAFT_2366683 [Lactarius hatsudake]|nr:hypothetical protein EDB86DRAFT_2366683 [Lactarius hatsudake]
MPSQKNQRPRAVFIVVHRPGKRSRHGLRPIWYLTQNVDGPFGDDPLIHRHIRVGAGVASGKSGGPTNEIDPAVEAAMEKAMGRFVKRGPPSTPIGVPTSHSAQYPSRGTQIRDPAPGTPPGPAFYTAPPASTTGNGRKPAQTATGHTTSKQKS